MVRLIRMNLIMLVIAVGGCASPLGNVHRSSPGLQDRPSSTYKAPLPSEVSDQLETQNLTQELFLSASMEMLQDADKKSPYGDPASTTDTSDFNTLRNIGYDVGYSESRKDPLWAAYAVPWTTEPHCFPRPSGFRVDARTEARLRHEDYAQDPPRPFNRGHMAPNHAIMSRYGSAAQRETFLMSNVVPQRAEQNQQVWRALEHLIAEEYSFEFDGVWVVTGPIFSSRPRRLNGLAAIPRATYSVIADDDEGILRVLAVIVDQDESGIQPLDKFIKTVDEVEEATGLDFFSKLPDEIEKLVESTGPDGDWGLERLLVPPPPTSCGQGG